MIFPKYRMSMGLPGEAGAVWCRYSDYELTQPREINISSPDISGNVEAHREGPLPPDESNG
jgi:hypothetical protein